MSAAENQAKLDTSDVDQVDRQAGHLCGDVGHLQCHRHPSLGAGDGLSQSHSLGRGIRCRLQVRRPRRAAVLHCRDGLWPWLPSGVRRQDSRHAPDLCRRGMVVLRHADSPRRQADAGATLRRLRRRRHQFRRADDVRSRRHGSSQPARRSRREGARHRDPLPGRGSQQAWRLRQGQARPEEVDVGRAGRDLPDSRRMDPVQPRRQVAALSGS